MLRVQEHTIDLHERLDRQYRTINELHDEIDDLSARLGSFQAEVRTHTADLRTERDRNEILQNRVQDLASF